MCRESISGSRKEVLVITGMKLVGEVVGIDNNLGSVRISVNSFFTLEIKGREDKDLLLCCIFKVSDIVLECFVTADEIALSLASEITKLHNSSQLRSYTNYYNC